MYLANHPGMFLNYEAAASLLRLENDHGVQPITSAGRTLQEGRDLLARWNRGGVYNRPPYLYEPANPPESSSHYKNGGEAVDTINWQWWRNNAGRYGWVVDFDWDKVHFRYDRNKDQFRNRGPVNKTIGDSEMLALDIADERGTHHKATLGIKVFRHLIKDDDVERMKNIVTMDDAWTNIHISELPRLLKTYGFKKLDIYRVDENGQFIVLDSETGQVRAGGSYVE